MEEISNNILCAYGAINKCAELLQKSSSGGVVSELCRIILEQGGAVCACSYDYDLHELRHIVIGDVAEIKKIRGSKYFQSNISDVYKPIEKFLKQSVDRKMLFVGTPCQCAAIKKYLDLKRVSRDKLFFVDIICHGVGSNQIWREFVKNVEKKAKAKIVNINFKDKRRGWLLPYAVAIDENGKEYDLCDYMTLYNKHLIMRDECYACSFASLNREGDITVGDFWSVQNVHPGFYNPQGVSNVLCNTEKGNLLFSTVMDKFDILPISVKNCIQPNMQYPTKKNALSDVFWSEYQKRGFIYVRKKYASKTKLDRIKRYFFVKIGLWKV